MPKYGLLVGNGFTNDLASVLDLNSSLPLQNFKNRDIDFNNFIGKLPAIEKELIANQYSNDFEAISNYVSRNRNNEKKMCQLRRFLACAYSSFQYVVDSYPNQITNWKWTRWLQENNKGLSLTISLNYDVILENALRRAKISYRRIGTDEPLGKVPLLKPHGSIDFDLPDSAISCPIDMRWNITTSLNDAQFVKVIPKSDWLLPRMEADLIPPSMFNIQRNLSWINEMYNVYSTQASKLEAFIIIGSSYWDVDRPEINYLLQRLNKKAMIYIMNPNPSPELLRTIKSLGLFYKLFSFNDIPW